MPKVNIATLKPVQRRLPVVAGKTGQSRTVAAFLLAWWNAESCGGFDLTDLWAVDDAIARDTLGTAAFVATSREYPTAYGLGPQFKQFVAQWRPALGATSNV